MSKSLRAGRRPIKGQPQSGFSLLELTLTVAIAALLMAGLSGVVGTSLRLQAQAQTSNELTGQARFALERMAAAVQGSRRLLLPLADSPKTNWPEHIRMQSVPAQPPQGSSSKATAVLAVTLDPTLDLDADGWADANNDKDYLDLNKNGVRDPGEPERIDEDPSHDNSSDGAPGLRGIDDDGDGLVDEGSDNTDNDEDGLIKEDKLDGLDNDGDGSVDEDLPSDLNMDLKAGVAGVDDDFDGLIDESPPPDDDEDGRNDEDWFDPVVFYLNGSDLIERWPSLVDTNGDGLVTGADFTESVIASSVSHFRIERVALSNGRAVLLDLTLELSGSGGQKRRFNTRLRLGARL
ncbi:PilW family protein [Pseudomonas benzenivorans]|uniref:Prepilin-type N-terminal cleavage/methylation domain-containing protein n=1 Tax=Pseudomonas benzenivorans TaxID=556533 RepID=A0ABY5H5J9_9PSED|nr:prepilin-type N-terminal cleavage/methylation domain-containing protein [Pseudomonas benzenivorans]UTW07132.1 prepilin-type N-terminal cleavage/methylation domain-containing protein [Pseudomonas benzenivorans]